MKGDNKLLREYGSGDGVKYGSSDALKYGSSDGVTLLLLSTIQGDAAIVRMILGKSVTMLNDTDAQGYGALWYAVFFSHVDVIRALLDAGSQLVPACPVSNLDSLTRDEQMLAFLRSAFTSHGDSGTTPTTVNSVSGSTVPRLLVDISTPASPLVEQRRKMHRIIPDAVFGGAGRSRALSTSSAATQLHRQHQALTIDHQPRMGKKKIRNVEASAAVDSLLADNQKTTESGAVAGAPSVDAMVSRLSRRSGFAMDAQESGGVGRNIIPSKIGDSVLSLETSSSSTTDARRTNSPHADTTNGVTSSAARPPLVAAVGELRARSVHPSETTTLAEFLRSIDLEALLPRLETAGRVTSIQALSELGDADMDAVVGATMGERRIIRMGLGYWRLAKIKRAVERERRRIDEMDGGGTASNSSGGAKTLSPATTSPTAHAHGSADMHAYYLKLKGDASGPP